MKKILSAVLAALVIVPTLAFAGVVRVEKELGWASYPNARPSGTVYTPRILKDANTDSTGVFSMSDVAFAGNGFPVGNGVSTSGGFSANDSLTVGYLVLYRDSTATGTTNLTGVTATFQASHDSYSWASVGGWGAGATSGDPTVTIPIVVTPSVAAHWNLLATKLRCYFSTVNGQLPAARVKLVYWADVDRR